MAEYNPSEVGYQLSINGEYNNTLYVEGFSKMMSSPSYCYKFYWLEALVELITRGILNTSFDEVINEMICNAWYSVTEHNIHLSGVLENENPKDALERAIRELKNLSGLPSNASKIEIKNAIKDNDMKISAFKKQLSYMVPYYALSGFIKLNKPDLDESIRKKIDCINKNNRETTLLPYTIGESTGLKREVYIHPLWAEMINCNAVAIRGWNQYEKVRWLQKINPEVPSLIYKLAPNDKERKLNSVRDLWNAVLSGTEVVDVFTNKPICNDKYDVDHFIPWSFVMNDELWNLMPMDSSLNSSKSNKLPNWDRFFARFAHNQYLLYGLIHKREAIHKLYIDCYKDNLNSIWARKELYIEGNSRDKFYHILENNMHPVYASARRQGYEIWDAV